MRENKKRDQYGAEAFDHAYEDDLTDMKVRLGDGLAVKIFMANAFNRILNSDISFEWHWTIRVLTSCDHGR